MAPLFYLCAAVSLSVALAGFFALGDVSQWVLALPRAFTYGVFRVRIPLMLLGLGALGTALVLGISERLAPWWALALLGLVFAVLFFAGFVAPTYVMFRTQQHSARYIPVAELDGQLA